MAKTRGAAGEGARRSAQWAEAWGVRISAEAVEDSEEAGEAVRVSRMSATASGARWGRREER